MKHNSYVIGYKSAYTFATMSHEGYRHILTLVQSHLRIDVLSPDFVTGAMDGAIMGARDRGRRK